MDEDDTKMLPVSDFVFETLEAVYDAIEGDKLPPDEWLNDILGDFAACLLDFVTAETHEFGHITIMTVDELPDDAVVIVDEDLHSKVYQFIDDRLVDYEGRTVYEMDKSCEEGSGTLEPEDV